MNRFFIPADHFQNGSVQFPPETAAQIRNVLRLQTGDTVQVLDNRGNAWLAALDSVSPSGVTAHLCEAVEMESEPLSTVILCLPLTRREKFEWMLQKCTECGVSIFQPFISERTLIQQSRDFDARKIRWQKIMQEAAEQSGRARLPQLLDPLPFSTIINEPLQNSLSFFFWEDAKKQSIHTMRSQFTPAPEAIRLMVGPEGGFSSAEAENAAKNGWQVLTLGNRILRLETAAMAAVLLINYELEQPPL